MNNQDNLIKNIEKKDLQDFELRNGVPLILICIFRILDLTNYFLINPEFKETQDIFRCNAEKSF